MSGRRDDSLLLDDLIDAAHRLIDLGGETLPGTLGAERGTAEMIQWNLLVLGEATKRMRPETRARFGDVDWLSLARTRDRIAHHYEDINWYLISEIIADELPAMLPRLIDIRDIVRAEFDAAI